MTHLNSRAEITLVELFPEFSSLFSGDRGALFSKRNCLDVPAGTTIFRQGDRCENYYLVLNGTIRVFARAENGREIVLYKIERGGSCVLTTSCLLGKNQYPAEGVAESDVKVLTIPSSVILEAIDTSSAVREFIFRSHSERLASLISFVSEVVFSRIDVRLAKYIMENVDMEFNLRVTHQQLAMELGSAREVISRQLKEFERRKFVRISRGEIQVIDQESLASKGRES